jgi:hypothetical protein
MTTKIYLICEDVDLGYAVKGVYDNRERAESKLKEYLKVWIKVRFFDQEIPEELLSEDGLFNAYTWHSYYIEEMELNVAEQMESDIERYLKFLGLKGERANQDAREEE